MKMPWDIAGTNVAPAPIQKAKPMAMRSVHKPECHGNGQSRKSRRERILRLKLFEKQDGCCFWCRLPMGLNHFHITQYGRQKHDPSFATFEHLKPKSMGGKNAKNIVLAHAKCNMDRKKRKWPHDPIYGRLGDT